MGTESRGEDTRLDIFFKILMISMYLFCTHDVTYNQSGLLPAFSGLTPVINRIPTAPCGYLEGATAATHEAESAQSRLS
jgi:hypothetical protein